MTDKRTDPSQSLLRGMPYTPAVSTDIRARFNLIRAAQAAQTAVPNVAPINLFGTLRAAQQKSAAPNVAPINSHKQRKVAP